jgi:hypothetical protein
MVNMDNGKVLLTTEILFKPFMGGSRAEWVFELITVCTIISARNVLAVQYKTSIKLCEMKDKRIDHKLKGSQARWSVLVTRTRLHRVLSSRYVPPCSASTERQSGKRAHGEVRFVQEATLPPVSRRVFPICTSVVHGDD